MKQSKIISLILTVLISVSYMILPTEVFAATSKIDDWVIQYNNTDYCVTKEDGSYVMQTGGKTTLELIKYNSVKNDVDSVRFSFSTCFDDYNLERLFSVKSNYIHSPTLSPEITILKFAKDGVCTVGKSGDTFEYNTGMWYNFDISVNMTRGTITALVSDGNTSRVLCGELASKLSGLNRVYFINFASSKAVTSVWRIKDYTVTQNSLISSTPADGDESVNPDIGTIKLEFDYSLKTKSEAKFLLNGSSNLIKNVSLSGKTLNVSIEPLEPFKRYVLSYSGVKNVYGEYIHGRIIFTTGGGITISDIQIKNDGKTADVLTTGRMSADFDVSSESGGKIYACAALYDKKSRKLSDVSIVNKDVSSISDVCSVYIDVDENNKNSEIKFFVWDSDLRPLRTKKPLPFERPEAEKVSSDLRNYTSVGSHPRLLVHKDEVEQIRDRVHTHSDLLESYNTIKAKADKILTSSTVAYSKKDGTRLSSAADVLDYVETLGFVYLISKDEKYAKRLYDELENAANYVDWNPYHFLDTANMMSAFAIGYDMAYDYISKDASRVAKLTEAVVSKGFEPLLDDYLDRERERSYKWSLSADPDNWNVVCNGGAILASLSFFDDIEQYPSLIMSYALPSLEKPTASFAPDGAWFEGVGYWKYMMTNYVNILASLNNSIGTDYGFSNVEGLDKTGYFLVAMTGCDGHFNFSDSDVGDVRAPSLFYLANLFDNKDFEKHQYSMIKKLGGVMEYKDILWYKGDFEYEPIVPSADYYFRDTEVCSMYGDNVYVGFCGGENYVEHSHLDIGSFVMDMEGVRFASDLGKEDYNISTTYTREAYRHRAEGHNTLVINPDISPDQREYGSAVIDRFDSYDNGAIAVCDMTSAYCDDVKTALRGIKLADNRKTVLIQDEVSCIAASEIWWFMHTDAEDITLSSDGKTAILTKDGKTIKAEILADGSFEVMNAKPLETSPQNDEQSVNSSYQKLAVHFENVTDIALTVRFSPLDYECTEEDYVPICEW